MLTADIVMGPLTAQIGGDGAIGRGIYLGVLRGSSSGLGAEVQGGLAWLERGGAMANFVVFSAMQVRRGPG
jgi:hypothetical protein